MKKLTFLFALILFSVSFTACNEDPLEEINPKFDLPDLEFTDGEDEELEAPPLQVPQQVTPPSAGGN